MSMEELVARWKQRLALLDPPQIREMRAKWEERATELEAKVLQDELAADYYRELLRQTAAVVLDPEEPL